MKQLLNRIAKEIHLASSKNISAESLRTVCLALGPYRNLTTFTASILFLHPECQVLNHAGQRIFGDNRLDFIKEYSDERFQRFCKYAINISTQGSRGAYGGSITHSHAFDQQYRLASTFNDASLPLLKPNITSLFWKESLRTSNHIRDNQVDLNKLFAKNDKVRFLLPIRNPLDCAVSSIKTGHSKLFKGVGANPDVKQVAAAILDEYAWFKSLERENPHRFCHYFEYESPRAILLRLAQFMELPAHEEWLENATRAFEINRGYDHSEDVLNFYRENVERKFARYPEFGDKLMAFVQPSHAAASAV